MNVVIITTQDEIYHQYFCAEIARRHNVVGVLHPQWPKTNRFENRRMRRQQLREHGLVHYLLWKLASNRFYTVGWDATKAMASSERRYFANARADYQSRISDKAHKIADINSAEGIKLLKSFEADVVIA